MTPTADQVLDAARSAVEVYFGGEFRHKRSIRVDMERLRALLRDHDAKQETNRITKP